MTVIAVVLVELRVSIAECMYCHAVSLSES